MESYIESTKTIPHLFYVDWDWSDWEEKENACSTNSEIVNLYQKYFTKAFIGFEVSKEGNVKHLQSYVEGSKLQYNSFIAKYKRLYEKKHGVPPMGRATKGKRKNYGRVKQIRTDEMNCISYCAKDQKYYYWGIEDSLVQDAVAMSYKKETAKDKRQLVINVFKQVFKNGYSSWSDVPYEEKINCIECVYKTHFEAFGTVCSVKQIEVYQIQSGLKNFRRKAELYVEFENTL